VLHDHWAVIETSATSQRRRRPRSRPTSDSSRPDRPRDHARRVGGS
jgi:hypothetical protein